MAGNFFGRLVNYFLTDMLTKTLANSHRFQRFALRIDSFVNTNKDAIAKTSKELEKQLAEQSKIMQEQAKILKEQAVANAAKNQPKIEQTQNDLFRFLSHMKNEIQKDLGIATKQAAKNNSGHKR